MEQRRQEIRAHFEKENQEGKIAAMFKTNSKEEDEEEEHGPRLKSRFPGVYYPSVRARLVIREMWRTIQQIKAMS